MIERVTDRGRVGLGDIKCSLGLLSFARDQEQGALLANPVAITGARRARWKSVDKSPEDQPLQLGRRDSENIGRGALAT